MTKTSTKYHDIDGVILLDKPLDLSSNAALQKVKRLFKARKAGHSGSLDPLATGLLPLCLGEATKFSQFLLEADKVYLVTAELGIKTATGDAEGEIIQRREFTPFSEKHLLTILEKFIGTIDQLPSMYSAIKHQGQPLYKLARQGIVVERKIRQVQIFTLDLLSHNETQLVLQVRCSKGTYIRTLIDDIGEALGCGAYVKSLRRTVVGPYREEQMVTLSELEKITEENAFELLQKYLLPLDSALSDWQELRLSEAAAYYLRRGQPVIVPYAPTSGWVRLRLTNGNFLGLGEILDDGRVAPKRLVMQIAK